MPEACDPRVTWGLTILTEMRVALRHIDIVVSNGRIGACELS